VESISKRKTKEPPTVQNPATTPTSIRRKRSKKPPEVAPKRQPRWQRSSRTKDEKKRTLKSDPKRTSKRTQGRTYSQKGKKQWVSHGTPATERHGKKTERKVRRNGQRSALNRQTTRGKGQTVYIRATKGEKSVSPSRGTSVGLPLTRAQAGVKNIFRQALVGGGMLGGFVRVSTPPLDSKSGPTEQRR